MDERDTKFQGFAHLLRQDIRALATAHYDGKLGDPRDADEYERLVHLLIAQRAYDLAVHILCEGVGASGGFARELLAYPMHISDLTEWPAQEP